MKVVTREGDWAPLDAADPDLDLGPGAYVLEPDASFPVGPVTVRARVTDADGGMSEWTVRDAIVEVIDNAPAVDTIAGREPSVLRGEVVHITVTVDDFETAPALLTVDAEVELKGKVWNDVPVEWDPGAKAWVG